MTPPSKSLARGLLFSQVAKAVYDNTVQFTKDWRRLSDEELVSKKLSPKAFQDKASGFNSALYENKEGKYALAFEGTDMSSVKDWKANFRQGMGLPAEQFNQTVALSRDVKEKLGPDTVLTGHSKGGGQAILGAAATGLDAVTFNPSGVHHKTLEAINIQQDKFATKASTSGQIQNFVVDKEVLDIVNGLLFTPSPDGQRFELQALKPKPNIFSRHRLAYLITLMENRQRDILKVVPETPSVGGGKGRRETVPNMPSNGLSASEQDKLAKASAAVGSIKNPARQEAAIQNVAKLRQLVIRSEKANPQIIPKKSQGKDFGRGD